MEKVNFKEVAKVVRFNLLSSINLPTPSEFEKLSDAEKMSIYRSLFGVHHDISHFLSSALDIDKLSSKYNVVC